MNPKPTDPRIRWDHPLARAANLWAFWPFSDAGGLQVSEQIQGAHAMLSGNTGSNWGSSAWGPGVEMRDAGTGEVLTVGTPYSLVDIWPATMTAIMRVPALQSTGNVIAEKGPFASSGWWMWRIFNNIQINFQKDWGGGNPGATVNVGIVANQWFVLSVTYNDGSNSSGDDIHFWRDGQLLTNSSTVSGTTWRTDGVRSWGFGRENASDMDLSGFWVHKGILTAGQIAEFHADPFAMSRRSTKTTLWVAATSGGAAPTGNRRRRFLIGAA